MPLESTLSPAPGAPATPPPPVTRRIGREEIVALARQGRLWEFLPLALRLLQQIPDDHGVRLLVATNYARLGLRTPAAEHLDRLPGALQNEASVVQLRAVLATLPGDEIATAERVGSCEANVRALARRGVDLTGRLAEWTERTRAERWFTTRDGNILRRAVTANPDEPWLHFRNDRAEAESFPLPHLATPDQAARPYVLEGISPAHMFLKLYERTPNAADGYRTRITVAQADEMEALDGLACADLRGPIADDRVHFVIGSGAGPRLLEDLRARIGTQGGPGIVLATVRTRAEPGVLQVLEQFAAEQVSEHRRLEKIVTEVYAPRDRAWWRSRYERPGEPLRVLVPTCRYSTFIKHSAADLAEAFTGAGWQARVLIEPDDRSHLSSVAYLRELAEFRPDLVVIINYTRTSIGNFFPANLPFVCWIQDAMPHQFDADLGSRQGPFDFLVGYLHRELFLNHKFPTERTAMAPVAASTRKFHAGPVAPEAARRHECEIAYASHHSETPEALHARLSQEAGAKEPLARRIFDVLWEEVGRIMRMEWEEQRGTELVDAARGAARHVLGADVPERTVTLLARQYCQPMADRRLRHDTLAWAARICARRGWRLHLYGKGWERHPTLAAHARGELTHDEELRASYQAARVHLHASSNWLLHQRVMECALSGGLPLSRLKPTDIEQWRQAVLATLARGAPVTMGRRSATRYPECGYAIADDAEAMAYAAQLQRLGLAPSWDVWIHERINAELRSAPEPLVQTPAGWYLGDLAETTFRTEAELEAMVERAITDGAWRERASALIAGRTRARYTTDALAARLEGMVRAELARDAGGAALGARLTSPTPGSSRSARRASGGR